MWSGCPGLSQPVTHPGLRRAGLEQAFFQEEDTACSVAFLLILKNDMSDGHQESQLHNCTSTQLSRGGKCPTPSPPSFSLHSYLNCLSKPKLKGLSLGQSADPYLASLRDSLSTCWQAVVNQGHWPGFANLAGTKVASINADGCFIQEAVTPERTPSMLIQGNTGPSQICSGLWLSNKYFHRPAHEMRDMGPTQAVPTVETFRTGSQMAVGVGWDFVKNQLFCHPLNKRVPKHSCRVRPRPAKGEKRALLRAWSNRDYLLYRCWNSQQVSTSSSFLSLLLCNY